MQSRHLVSETPVRRPVAAPLRLLIRPNIAAMALLWGLGSPAHAVSLHPPGAEAIVTAQFSAITNSDSGTIADVDLTDPFGSEGSARAEYNGDVKAESDSFTGPNNQPNNGSPGDSITATARQATIFEISDSILNPGDPVTLRANLHLGGNIHGIDSPQGRVGAGNVALNVELRRETAAAPDNDFFQGFVAVNANGDVLGRTGFTSEGQNPHIIVTGPSLSLLFNEAILFDAIVGERFSLLYELKTVSSGTFVSDFSATGNFSITPVLATTTVNPVPVPLPAALPLLLAGIGGLVAIGRKKTSVAGG